MPPVQPPLLGDGSVVGDYTLLYRYWEELRRRGKKVDDAVLREEDFRRLREIMRRVEEGERITLEHLLDELTDWFLPRVDREAAREAARRTYGVDLGAEAAARRVARIMAGWLVEAAKQSKMLRLSGPRLPPD